MKLKNIVFISALVVGTSGCGVIPGTSIQTIEPGYTGLKIQLYGGDAGVDSAELLKGGRIWYNQYTEVVVNFPTFVNTYPWTKDATEGSPTNEEICFSVSGTKVCGDVAISFAFSSDPLPGTKTTKLHSFYKKYRKTPDEFRLGILRNATRDCFANSAEQLKLNPSVLFVSQQQLLDLTKTCVQAKFPEVIIEGLSLLNPFRVPPEIQSSIDAQFKAVQDAQTAVANQQKAEAEAKAKVAEAKGEAQANIEKARGEAESEIQRAKGEAEANRLRNSSLTPMILKMKELEIQKEEIEKWNGVKPGTIIQTPNTQIQAPSQ